jgi:hypothetical protein
MLRAARTCLKSCVPCTFKFLISASPHPKLTTLGISLGGQPVKHQQLVRQIGGRVEDPPASSMLSFNFIRSVPSQGTTFVFGSWVCIADGAGSFRRFLVDMMPKTVAADPRSGLDKFVGELDNLPLHASTAQIEMESVPSSTSYGVATTSPGLDLLQSRDSRGRTQPGLCESATDLQEANASGSLSMLDKDLDLLLRDGNPEATVCREASGCSGPGDLVITSSPKGHIMHWRGMTLSNLLEAESRLVAHLEPLPFQEGRPLATAAEGSTELVDESSHELSSRQVLMAEEGEDGGDLPIDNFDVISEDEITANVGNENDANREARRARNRARTIRRRRANERRRSMHRELDPEFAAASERASGLRWPTSPGSRPSSSAATTRRYVKHSSMRRGLGSSWINIIRRPSSRKSAWTRAEARPAVERLVVVLNTRSATTTHMGARPLAGGSSHRKGVICDRPVDDLLRRTCASISMKVATRAP